MQKKLDKGVLLFDKQDLPLVSRYRWKVDTNGYARASIPGGREVLHRILMGVIKGDPREVDHINGNRLDNRRTNLRVCTLRQNRANAKLRCDSTTGFKGVGWLRGSYYCNVRLSGFKTAEEAARAYDKLAKVAFGEFARLNFPNMKIAS